LFPVDPSKAVTKKTGKTEEEQGWEKPKQRRKPKPGDASAQSAASLHVAQATLHKNSVVIVRDPVGFRFVTCTLGT
jgi:hypothetical protein